MIYRIAIARLNYIITCNFMISPLSPLASLLFDDVKRLKIRRKVGLHRLYCIARFILNDRPIRFRNPQTFKYLVITL